MQNLQEQLGNPITASALAKYLGVSIQTVKRYPERWGGIEVSPRRILFFDRIVAGKLLESGVHRSGAEVSQPTDKSRKRRLQDPYNLAGGV